MNIHSDAASYNNEEMNFMKAIYFLNSEDVKKLYFLCLDKLPGNIKCPNNAECLFSLLKLDQDTSFNLLKELLFYIKKYKLLRLLNTCRHQMEIELKNGPRFINPGRLLLFNVCEDLKNSDIESLKSILKKDSIPHEAEWENVAAEEFFSIWLREISKENIDNLQKALSNFPYFDNKKFEEKCRNYFEKPYPVKIPSPGKPCGIAIIFSFKNFNSRSKSDEKLNSRVFFLKERNGAEADEKLLIKMWHKFGFDVLVFKDLCSTDMIHIFDYLEAFQYDDYSIFVCCILTHGVRGMIYTSDNIPLDIYADVVYRICIQALEDKPKLFFVQACQVKSGDDDQIKKLSSDAGTMNNQTSRVLERHLMVALSTTPLKMAFRYNGIGSWFINDLFNVFTSYDTTKIPLLELMNKVNHAVTERSDKYRGQDIVQTPQMHVTVLNPLYLKQLTPYSEPQKAVEINTRPLLFQLISNFRIRPSVYLI